MDYIGILVTYIANRTNNGWFDTRDNRFCMPPFFGRLPGKK